MLNHLFFIKELIKCNGCLAGTAIFFILTSILMPQFSYSETYIVTHINDTIDTADTANYEGSLREAITKANNTPESDIINFDVNGIIKLVNILPEITDSQLIIDGTSAPGYTNQPLIELDGTSVFDNGLVINADNIEIKGLAFHSFFGEIKINTSNNYIHDCYIGVDTGLNSKSSSSPYGIFINNSSNNIIENNIISGIGGYGVWIAGALSASNSVKANFIGTNASNITNIGNNIGISISSNSADNNIQINAIAYNKTGILITDSTGNQILGNRIYNNEDAGIVCSDPKTPAPVLRSITKNVSSLGEATIAGELNASAGTYRIDFFASSDNAAICGLQGETHIGYPPLLEISDADANTDVAFEFTFQPPFASYILSATATKISDERVNTSEFSCKNHPPENIIPDPANEPQVAAPNTAFNFSPVISVKDFDDKGTDELEVTLEVDAGNLSSDNNPPTTSISLTDTIENINLELQTLSYISDISGKLTITTKDKAPAELGGPGITIDNISIIVSSTDAFPEIANPIKDVVVNEGAQNTIIDLSKVFTDIDNDDSKITKSVNNAVDNNNPTLVTVSIIDNTLTLAYEPNQTGTADITIHGTSNNQSVTDTFIVTVYPANHAPVLDSTQVQFLPPIKEDTPSDNITGILIADIIGDTITDTDADALEGIGIIAADNSKGQWQYDIGDGFKDIIISTNEALLLTDVDKIRFVPNTDFFGNTEITFRAWDRTGGGINGNIIGVTNTGGDSPFSAEVGAISIIVENVDDAPEITTTFLPSAREGVAYNYKILVNNPDNDNLFWSLVDNPADMEINDGIISWTPGEGITSSGEFTVIAADNEDLNIALKNIAKFTISVISVNNPPQITAVADENRQATEDTLYTYLVGFVDPDNIRTDMIWSLTQSPEGMTIDDKGEINWTPGEGIKSAPVTVKVVDKGSLSDEETFLISVESVNDAPVLISASLVFNSINEDDIENSGTLVSTMLNSDTGVDVIKDEDDNSVQGIAVTQTTGNGIWQYSQDNGANFTDFPQIPENQALLLNNEAIIRFIPARDFFGSPEITFQAWDQTAGISGNLADISNTGGSTAFSIESLTASLTIVPVNDMPNITASDPPAVNEDAGPKTLNGWAVFSPGPDNESGQSITNYMITNISNTGLFSVLPAIDDNGTLTYTPADDAYGTSSFSIILTDNGGTSNGGIDSSLSSPDTFTITVNNINDAPILNNTGTLFLSSNTDTVINSILTSDTGIDNIITDKDDDALQGIAVIGVNTDHGTWQYDHDLDGNFDDFPVNLAEDNALLLEDTSLIRFVPNDDFTGVLDEAVTFRAWDRTQYNNGDINVDTTKNGSITAFSVQTETIFINEIPTISANPDTYTVNENTDLSITAPGVLSNDTHINNNILSAEIIKEPLHGAVTLNPDGSFIYTPNTNFTGIDSFTYKAGDGVNSSLETKVNITIIKKSEPEPEPSEPSQPVSNSSPSANSDTYHVNQDTILEVDAEFGVLANDSDADGNKLTASLVSDAIHGTLDFNSDGSLKYTPNTGFTGTDTFTYQASDGSLFSKEAQVSIIVQLSSDNKLTANADFYSVDEDNLLDVDAALGVLSNDVYDNKESILPVIGENSANGGKININPDGSFTYIPEENFNGVDIFTYKIKNNSMESEPAAVSITVNPINDVPYIIDQTPLFFIDDSSVVIALDNITVKDPDNNYPDDFTLKILQGENYILEGSTIRPAAGFTGTLVVPIIVNDGIDNSLPFNLNIGSRSFSDKDGDGMPDDWEWEIGLNYLSNDANEDKDHDGYTNIEEYRCETNPVSPDSSPNSPIADAGPDQIVIPGLMVQLNGIHSKDIDGIIKSYKWEQKSGTPVILSDSSDPRPKFTAHNVWPGGDCLRFELTITDDCGLIDTDSCIVNITLENQPPKADAGQNQNVLPESMVILDGADSINTDDNFMTYFWSQISGAVVDLSDPADISPSFIAPEIKSGGESLVFRLTVTDQSGLQSDSNQIVNIIDPDLVDMLPQAQAEEPLDYVLEGTSFMLDGSDSNAVAYQWRQLSGPPVTLSNPDAAKTELVIPSVDKLGATLEFELIVENENKLQDSQIVRLRVKDNGIQSFKSEIIPFTFSSDQYMGITTNSKSGLTSVKNIQAENIPDSQSLPQDLVYGRIDVKVKVEKPGDSSTISLYLQNPASVDSKWFAYTSNQGWFDYSEHTVFNEDRTQVNITIVDGGPEDEDGTADRSITFLSGLSGKPDITDKDEPGDNPDDKDDTKDEDTQPTESGGDSGGWCFINALFE